MDAQWNLQKMMWYRYLHLIVEKLQRFDSVEEKGIEKHSHRDVYKKIWICDVEEPKMPITRHT